MVKHKTKKKVEMIQYGSWVFGFGLLLSLVVAFLPSLGATTSKIVFGTLIILGIVIGFLNVTNDESIKFLVSAVALVLLTGPFLGLVAQNLIQTAVLGKFFGNLIALIVPAAIIVSLKELFLTAKDE